MTLICTYLHLIIMLFKVILYNIVYHLVYGILYSSRADKICTFNPVLEVYYNQFLEAPFQKVLAVY